MQKSLEELFKNASPPNQTKFHPKVRRSTLNTTWQAVDEKENRPTKSPNNKKGKCLTIYKADFGINFQFHIPLNII